MADTIALLTDFGLADAYAGIMKGVMLARCAGCAFIDLSHTVPRQDVAAAAYLLWTAYRYLPPGTVTLVVVDPGVGTSRRPIAVQSPHGCFVGPDNGFLSRVLADAGVAAPRSMAVAVPAGWKAVELTNRDYWLHPVSRTFHGRDIFAPCAAALASGVDLERLGPLIETICALAIPGPEADAGIVRGHVVNVDHFGNLVTNIPEHMLVSPCRVYIGDFVIRGLSHSYATGSRQDLVALIGSAGTVEIAVPFGSAAAVTGASAGVTVEVRPGAETDETPV